MKKIEIPAPLRISFLYLLLGVLWIFFSSRLVGFLVHDPILVQRLEILKGWAFITVTTVFLYYLVRRELARRQQAQQALKISNERLGLIAQVAGTVVGATPLFVQAEELAEQVRKAFAVDGCVIRIFEDNAMVLLGSAGIPRERLQLQMTVGWGISREIIEKRRPAAIEDVCVNPITAAFTTPTPSTYSFKSYAGAPLLEEESIIGLLGIYSEKEVRRFTAADLEHLQIVANHIALAVTNDRLYKEVRAQNTNLAQQIQEREKAEQRVREHAALLDKARDAILVCGLDNKIVFWNESATRMFGWAASEVMEKSVKELLLRDVNKFETARSSVLENGEWAGELSQVTKEGREILVESRWTLVRDNAGVPKSVFVINTDITERKKLELQFLRAQRTESIGTLAGGIAHDLNNVLAPILMSIALLKQKHPDEETAEVLETLENSANRGADMVKQVLSYARGVEGDRVRISAASLLEDMEKIMADTFPKSIRIEKRIDSSEACLLGDSTQLHQILLNLCVNARDAMPNGGALLLSAETVLLDEKYKTVNPQAKPGSYVALRVSDTGTGIPPEVRIRIFEPFFTTKEIGKGSGLGLSTTLAIVKSHGGFIDVSTEVGKGSTFTVYLPAQNHSAVLAAASDEILKLSGGHGEMVLVVEDEVAVRKATQKTLQTFGYQVITANDGAEALAIYRQRQSEIAVVLTDMMMPVMDGMATIERLKKMNPDVKIIAASGNFSKAWESSGVKAILEKPYTAEALLKTLRQVLNKTSP
jgi:PAS domain S-box-containing protein